MTESVLQKYKGQLLLTALVVAALLVGLTFRRQRRRYDVQGEVELRNRGNVPARYRLRVQGPDGELSFRLSVAGAPLEPWQIT